MGPYPSRQGPGAMNIIESMQWGNAKFANQGLSQQLIQQLVLSTSTRLFSNI